VALAGADHPLSHRATTDLDAGAREGRFHAVQRHAVGIFAGHDGGDRGGIGHAARQWLCRHVSAHHRRADLVLFAMAAAVLETHMLPNPRGHRRDMQLFADVFADAVQRALAAAANLLLFGQIVFDALARQVRRQGLTSTLLGRRWRDLWQASIGQRHGTILRRGAHLLGFVEHPFAALLATGSIALELRQTELLFELANTH
jgi:hypothetical protein